MTALVGRDVEPLLAPLVRAADRETVLNALRRAGSATGDDDRDAAWLPACVLIADLVAEAETARSPARADVDAALAAVADRSGVGRDRVATAAFLLAVRKPTLLLTPGRSPADVLRVLPLLLPVSEASLWLRRSDGEIHLVESVGARAPTRASRDAARRAILGAGESAEPGGRRQIHALRLESRGEPLAALVVRASAESARVVAFAREAADVLELWLECRQVVDESAASQTLLIQSEERLLRMVGFNLHDGPLQELARLRGDLQVVRRRVAESEAAPAALAAIGARLDSIVDLAVGAESRLRAMARSLAVPPYLEERFGTAVERGLSILAGTQIRPKLVVEGALESLTQQQRVAIVSILREALANVRAHSRATRVRVRVRAEEDRAQVEIVDNGVGFDVTATLSAAARRGRLGLLSMRERARILGGSCRVSSKPGGPTRVSVVLPARLPGDADGHLGLPTDG